MTFRNTTDHSEEDKDMLLSIKAINKKQEISKIEQKQNQQYLKKLVALLICSNFCCVHTDGALLFIIIGGWKFSTSLSSTLRSQMVSTSCGLNTKHGEAPMRFQPACLSPLGSKHLRMSNRLKCSQTIAVDKTASFTAFALYARNYFNMTRIAHTFFEKGLHTPEQWFAAVRGARTSKQIHGEGDAGPGLFFYFKTMSSSAKNLSTDDNGEIMWNETRQLVVSSEDHS